MYIWWLQAYVVSNMLWKQKSGPNNPVAKCLPGMPEVLDSLPSTTYTKHGGHACHPSTREQENDKVKAIFSYTGRWRPA